MVECIKYASGQKSPLSEEWLAGRSREVPHPELVVNFEIAAYNKRLIRSYGQFYGLEKAVETALEDGEADAVTEEEIEADAHVGCGACGTVGDWHWKQRTSIYRWVRECHAAGVPALAGSRWTPDGSHVGRRKKPPD